MTPGTMKLLQSSKKEITKNRNSENLSHLVILVRVLLILVLCNIINNSYQQNSRVL